MIDVMKIAEAVGPYISSMGMAGQSLTGYADMLRGCGLVLSYPKGYITEKDVRWFSYVTPDEMTAQLRKEKILR